MIALVEAYRAGLFGRKQWLPNIISGVVVGIVALPLAMAFAIASGVKPEQGIYTAIIAGLIVSCLGGSRLQIAGPTGAFVVILSGVTAQYGMAGLQLATMMAGGMLLVLGLTRTGSIVKYIPDQVIIGFTAGIGMIIWVGQWQYFFGLPPITGEYFHQKVWHLLQVLPQLHLTTTVLAILSVVLIIYSPRLPGLQRLPGPLVALVSITLLQVILGFEGVVTIGDAFGDIPSGMPEFALPQFTLHQIIDLTRPAFAIAMLGAIESLLSAVVADSMASTHHDSNQELIGQGLANIVAPLFGGFAATGAIARTATNVRNGGTGPLAGIMHALTLVIVLIVLIPYAVHIPLFVLAAILFVVAWNMSEPKNFIKMLKRAPLVDVAILLITFILTVFVDLIVAVNIGVILATLNFLRRMATSVDVLQLNETELNREISNKDFLRLPPEIRIYSVDGPFFFGAVEGFEHALSVTDKELTTLIIHLKRVPFIDITGIQTLEEVIERMHKRGIRVMLSSANARVTAKLEKAGVINQVGRENYFSQLHEAVNVAL